MGAESRQIVFQEAADVKGDSTGRFDRGTKGNVTSGGQEYPLHTSIEIDGAFQPLSTTIVQTIAEFADAHMVRIGGTSRCKAVPTVMPRNASFSRFRRLRRGGTTASVWSRDCL